MKAIIEFLTNHWVALTSPVVIALIGGVWTITQFRIQQAYSKAKIHFEFQQQYKAFRLSLPNEINNKDKEGNYNYCPPQGKELEYERKLQGYWWFVFDEWFICCKQCKRSCKSLWDDYYSKGVLSALERSDFRKALVDLIELENSFLGQDRAFKTEINKLYMEKHKSVIFSL